MRFYNKKEPIFKDFEFFENRFFLFTKYNICAEKSLTRFGTGDPSPTILHAFYAINLCIKRADIESAPTEFRRFAANMRGKIITHYALSITH